MCSILKVVFLQTKCTIFIHKQEKSAPTTLWVRLAAPSKKGLPVPGLAPALPNWEDSGGQVRDASPPLSPPVTDVTPHNKKTLTSCSMHQFKIGITERPDLRWPMYKNSKDDIKWTTMFILYAAPTSKSAMCSSDSTALQALKKTSTGSMEKHLIRFFRGLFDNCVNDAPGGERPSDGNPHFTYVVIGDETCKKKKRRRNDDHGYETCKKERRRNNDHVCEHVYGPCANRFYFPLQRFCLSNPHDHRPPPEAEAAPGIFCHGSQHHCHGLPGIFCHGLPLKIVFRDARTTPIAVMLGLYAHAHRTHSACIIYLEGK